MTLLAMTVGMVVVAALLTGPRPAAAGDPSIPVRADSANRPIMFIHGFDPAIPGTTKDCRDVWGPAMKAIKAAGWTGRRFTFGLYYTSAHCDYHYDGTPLSGINDLGKAVAWNIYNHFSVNGQPIDVIAHSMGGLVIRAAIAGVNAHQGQDGWPPYVYVEDVATLGAPHDGPLPTFLNTLCGAANRQCVDMEPNGPYLLNLARNPQSAMGTDWTLVGSVADDLVDYTSEIDEIYEGTLHDWAHRVYYPLSVDFSHFDLRKVTTGTYDMVYRNGSGGDTPTPDGAAPVIVAMNAVYWSSAW